MARTRISSGSRYEELASYSRAVVDGDWIFVAGTTGFDYATGEIAEDAAAQAEQCFRTIRAALDEVGRSLADTVRIRVYLGAAEYFDTVAPVVGKHMKDAMPANTTVVAPLIDPRMKVEIEVTAKRQG